MDVKPTNSKEEILKYLTIIFPLVDLPFGILCVVLSDNWIFTLCFLPVFHFTAFLMILMAKKRKSFNPGAFIFMANGINYFIFQYISGPEAPGWGMLINITIGASFMFNNEKVGQWLLVIMSLLTGSFFYFIGASWEYSVIIMLVLISVTGLFARTYSYLKMQQRYIETKNLEIEAKNKDITDSINYSKRIQTAVLPIDEVIQRSIPLYFVLYKPKDIVSGDFYWFHEISSDEYIIVCADCTGHGVPGALMTVIGSNILNQVIVENKVQQPSEILRELDQRMITTLKQQSERTMIVQDGMDCGLLHVNKKTKELVYAGAKRSAFFIRDGISQELKASKLSIGGLRSGEKKFEEVKINYQMDDMIYLYTDGFPDQFGGLKAKKYSTKRLKEDFSLMYAKPLAEQKNSLENKFESWRENTEQIDDVCVIGIKF